MDKDYKKLYEEALKRAKYWEKQPTVWNSADICQKLFPELMETKIDINENIKNCIGVILTDASEQRFNDFGINLKDCLTWLKKQCEQKSIEQDTEIHDLWVYIREWNEKFGRLPKDEDELTTCIDYVMKRQKPAEWSEKCIADVFEKVGLAKIVREQRNDQLTNAVQSAMIELSKQHNHAWREEDRKHIDNIISLLNQAKERFIRKSGQFPSWITEILWLKSIKPNHWKPSEEQMKTLAEWLKNHQYNGNSRYIYPIFQSLYNDLKKL